MDGKCRKVDVSKYKFVGGGGVYCNNKHRDLLFQTMKSKFGKPNANSLRSDDCTWMYVLEYRGAFLTIYDYGHFWSQGFLELENAIPDYELMYAVSRMLNVYLKQQLDLELQEVKEAVLV